MPSFKKPNPTYVTPESVLDYLEEDDFGTGDPGEERDHWTLEQITAAMEGAARAANSIPPFSIEFTSERLPAKATDAFYQGVLAQLYTRRADKLMRGALEYEAGNVTGDPDVARAKVFLQLAERAEKEFKTGVKDFKLHINIRRFYAHY